MNFNSIEKLSLLGLTNILKDLHKEIAPKFVFHCNSTKVEEDVDVIYLDYVDHKFCFEVDRAKKTISLSVATVSGSYNTWAFRPKTYKSIYMAIGRYSAELQKVLTKQL